jgi:azurin
MKKYTFILASMTIAWMASCGGNTEKATETTTAETATPATPETNNEDGIVAITIESNDEMKYNLKTLEAKVGEKVALTLINKGSMPKEAMGHNWTLLSQGVDLEEYALAAAKEKTNDYQVKGREGDVIAHTKMLGPGESETIVFDAPAAGTYKFICTFPAHYGLMQGDFIVK